MVLQPSGGGGAGFNIHFAAQRVPRFGNVKYAFLAPRIILLRRKIAEMLECANPYDLQWLGRPPGGEIHKSCTFSQKLHFLHFCALFAKKVKFLKFSRIVIFSEKCGKRPRKRLE